jgi:alpha-amylase
MLQKLRAAARGSKSGSDEDRPVAGDETPADNLTLLEAFEWYAPADGKHWRRLAHVIPHLKEVGIDYLWLPPGCKAGWHGSNGYDTYDLWDLGEFEQKGHRATKWGSVEELLALVDVAQRNGMGLLWDAVLNHKSAADYVETCRAVAVDKEGR